MGDEPGRGGQDPKSQCLRARLGQLAVQGDVTQPGGQAHGQGGQLQTVIDEYRHSVGRSEDGDLRELAAEAEALMGQYDARRATSLAELLSALGRFDRATKLTAFTDRRLGFRIAQATFLARAGESDRACEKIKQAQELVPPGAAAPSVDGLNCS